jgi:aldehyde dehydrogenase (NAD+)
MTTTPENVRLQLEADVQNNDFSAFSGNYVSFLKRFSSFRKAYSPGPADVVAHSAIFGQQCFHLKQTNDAQGQEILAQSRAASRVFGSLTLEERLDFLEILQRKIADHKEEIELVITADTGKPIDLSATEMDKGNEWFQYAYETAAGQLTTVNQNGNRISPRPLGAAQIIGAYNYPYALAVGGIVGALASGNGVIVSAPLKAPNWVFPFMEAAQEAVEAFSAVATAEGKPWVHAFRGIADGLIQCSVGVNTKMTADADLVHFVGGDYVGGLISKSRGHKPTILEMGGSNVAVVMESALRNPDSAEDIARALYAGFGPATGQRCTAPRMLCVQSGAEGVVEALAKLCAEADHHIGNPFSHGVKMGPLVDRGAHQKMAEAIEVAEKLGAKVHGTLKVNSNVVPQSLNENSYWVNPIVIDWSGVDISDPATAAQIGAVLKNEIFGPLLHVVHSVSTVGDAISVTNRLDGHGLAGAIFTGSEDEAQRYEAGVSVTSLTVNGVPKDRSPWGPHGHPGLATIGGATHFRLYSSFNTVFAPKFAPG